MDFSLAFILFNPGTSVRIRIAEALDMGYEVYLFDNSPQKTEWLDDFINNNGVSYFCFGLNAGLGLALRVICSTAYRKGWKYLLYFDQDTVFTRETLNFIEDGLSVPDDSEHEKNEALCVTFRDSINSKPSKGNVKYPSITRSEVKFTISSGTLFSLKELKRIGWHDASFFIDGVDYAVCVKARKKGLKILENYNTPGLNHEMEQNDSVYSFLGMEFKGRLYPWNRRLDVSVSSLRLMVASYSADPSMSFWLLTRLLVFWLKQVLIAFSHEKK